MGNVKINGEEIPDRRTNGARIKLDLGDWLKIITVIITVVLCLGQMKWQIAGNSVTLAAYALDIQENIKVSRDNRKDIENLKASIDRIDKNVLEIIKRVR